MLKKHIVIFGLSFLLFALSARADMTLVQAIDLAIQNNINVRLSQAKNEEERGKALKDASNLLPKIVGGVSESRVFKVNLEASGFEPGQGFDTILGPYNVFDARISLVQNIFDLNAIWKAKAGYRAADAAKLEVELTKEQVATSAALSYLDLVRALRAVEAAKKDAELASSLLSLTNDQKNSGLTTGVDVARAQTREAESTLRVIRAQTMERQSSLRLSRLLDLPLDQPIVPADSLEYSSSTVLPIEQALVTAQSDRLELKIADLIMTSEKNSYDSARAANAPALIAAGDYGLSGSSPSDQIQTGSIGARLNVPIFSGREMEGETKSAEAKFHQAELKLEDTRKQVEEDVRLSLDLLSAEEQEVATAKKKHELAEREMQMARDRYSAGVGDNIQIIAAQNSLAQSDDDVIGALARYDEARINFNMSLGHVRAFTSHS